MQTVTGYDGNVIAEGDRVELHPGTDLWARGARFGSVDRIKENGFVRVSIDKLNGAYRHFFAERLRRV